MLASRRRVLASGSALLIPLSGCAALVDTGPTIIELEIVLVNQTEETHVFHVAVEMTDGLGEWTSREVAPGSRATIIREPSEDVDPVAIHGVVDDHTVRGEVIGVDEETTGEVCPRIVFEYGLGEEPVLLESTELRC